MFPRDAGVVDLTKNSIQASGGSSTTTPTTPTSCQPPYSENISATAVAHYLAQRLTVAQYNALGAHHGYTTPFDLYHCTNGWTDKADCFPIWSGPSPAAPPRRWRSLADSAAAAAGSPVQTAGRHGFDRWPMSDYQEPVINADTLENRAATDELLRDHADEPDGAQRARRPLRTSPAPPPSHRSVRIEIR
jgi:hypothetical protein